MQIIEGFEKAKAMLSREVPFVGLTFLPERPNKKEPSIGETVKRILLDVRTNGDKALFHYTSKLDGVELSSLEVTQDEISTACKNADERLIAAIKLAADRIEKFHSLCKQKLKFGFHSHGLGRQIRPLSKVGIYVPGGTAAYPSTVLMTAIPARIAGVEQILMTTPPQKDGSIPPATLVAANIAKVDRIFKIGGAQAIAALAFGTESVPRVDKVCGPGNVFVVTAKKMVYGIVDVDGLQGPSEIVIVADHTANASYCAADLIAQAEHDPQASAILITISSKLAEEVQKEVNLQLLDLERRNMAEVSLKVRGAIVLVSSIDEAIELVNLYAPEHVSLILHNPGHYVRKIRNAGCILIGDSSPVALGDYIAGPSHVLPTGGSARFGSPLSVEDFLKITNIVALDKTKKRLAEAAITIAEAEGLKGHAKAISKRLLQVVES